MSRCVILSACPVSPELAKLLRPDDFIIACDAGYRNCTPLGCKPNIIVGDFDTAPCPEQQDDDIVVLPHVKDDTDTEYAAKLVSQKGFAEVLLLGALGGKRLEHTLANLCTGLGMEQRGVLWVSPETSFPIDDYWVSEEVLSMHADRIPWDRLKLVIYSGSGLDQKIYETLRKFVASGGTVLSVLRKRLTLL